MIVQVLNSFKVTDGTVYIGGTTIEVDRFGALNPDVQRELIKKTGFFRLIDGALPSEEPPEEVIEETPPETEEVPRFVGNHRGGGRWNVIDQETGEIVNEEYINKHEAAALVEKLEKSAGGEPERTLPRKDR